MIASRFQKGQEAWNKGTKGIVGVQDACRATQFKAGAQTQTWRPVGTYAIDPYGLLKLKVTDLRDPPRKDWVYVHRQAWERANGAIPGRAHRQVQGRPQDLGAGADRSRRPGARDPRREHAAQHLSPLRTRDRTCDPASRRPIPPDQQESRMSQDLTALREHLFAALQGVKDGTLDLDKARAMNELGKTLVDTAKVEVDYLRATGGGESTFIDTAAGADNLPEGITRSTVHRLR